MKLGLLSDTHGNRKRSRHAIHLLLSEGAEMLIHCGDIGSEDILYDAMELIQPAGIPLYAVLGNVDWIATDYRHLPDSSGIKVMGRCGRLELSGQTAAIIHGDELTRLSDMTDAETYDYIFTGHTHVAADYTEGRTRIINPGAVHRSPTPSCALLNINSGHLKTITL